ncbi:penicillin-binding protein 2 [Candidatus Berkelbacteria bacterium CG10_big_fil_rev_8_21_14_0_10_41_12]|uniref:Penicillin-binding protein 2 n=1 Tax=Candidatus Berkelbacteria bacterium CG10_big_fil_rev_8_21_14_0_10_41_12 TaxID=1974513 RepID=A0A2M6WWX0_9BACT|nr:MAG: penicillin-binding protein 2 [Candidatus Berkelbacteria bacterium CG10_big_fil_rev_8_21_14_0_10_41_12]
MKIKNFKDIFGNFNPLGKISGVHSDLDDLNSLSSEEVFRVKGLSRIRISFLAPILLFIILVVRLFSLQVQEGIVNKTLAEGNRIKLSYVSAPRGGIVDNRNETFVKNIPSYVLQVSVSQLPKDKNQRNNLIAKVAGLVGMSLDEIISTIDKAPQNMDTIALKEGIERDKALLMKSKIVDYSAFEVTTRHERQYDRIVGLSHVIGYISKPSEDDIKQNPAVSLNGVIGKSGIEQQYDKYLQGTPGEKKMEVDAQGRVVRILSSTPSVAGKTIQLSIDKELESFASQHLQDAMKDVSSSGVVIVEDPKSGAIKAMLSIPDYDSSLFSEGLSQDEYNKMADDPNKPLFNRAITGVYPPGSSIKPFIASGALESGNISEDFSVDTPLTIRIGQWTFTDWKDHGVTDVKRAIAESNNIFFYALGGGWNDIKGLGPDGLQSTLDKFGFGKKEGIDIGSEASGFIPTPQWKENVMKEPWYIGNTYNMSIGQGDLTVTPLQLTNATAIIANGGTLYRPHFISKIFSSTNEDVPFNNDFKIKEHVFSDDTLRIVREGMRETVTLGSARSVFPEDFPVEVAAKTGTAQFGNEGKTHAWFSSFAPYDNPEIVVTVLIEGGGEGYQVAAPVARDILEWWNNNRENS